MSFDSIAYLIFLPVVYGLYLTMRRQGQNVWLLAASYLFYGWWDVRFLFLIVLSTAIDYCCGLLIERGRLEPRHFAYAGSALVAGFLFFVVSPVLMGTGGTIALETVLPALIVVALFLIFGPMGYRFVRTLDVQRQRRVYLITSICSNLGILGVFKYFDFFVSSAETMAASMGVGNVELLHLNVVLPVGISFYTFQTLSYSIGIYRGECKPTEDFVGFSLFVAFFPQLVAGPIERAQHLLPIILSRRVVSLDQVAKGLYLILLGLFKKVAVSDGMAIAVDSIYNSSGAVSSLDVAAATFCFAIQIYCDFSGYSDIARGSAKLFGIDLMRNFEQPYFSSNPSEFWRRWHISLSSWLRDYLYIPLGGNRDGNARTYRNLTLTMLLGGLWHGAAWNFVLWGAYQGLMLSVHRFATRTTRFLPQSGGGAMSQVFFVALFFCFTCYGWLLFRATSFDQIVEFTKILFFGFDFSLSMQRPTLSAISGLLLLILVDLTTYRTQDPYVYRRIPVPAQGFLFASLLFILCMGLSNEPTQFIYFQF